MSRASHHTFSATLWLYPGQAAWHFITLPVELAKELDFYHAHHKAGWGSLKVEVLIGHTTWQTSIFPDKKAHSYLLPIKASVRLQEKLLEGDEVEVKLSVAT